MGIKSLVLAALASALIALACTAPGSASPTAPKVTADGVWPYNFKSLQEIFDTADVVVVAQVLEVGPGRVIETEPVNPRKSGAIDLPKTYFTNAKVQVSEYLGRSELSAPTLTVSQPGGETTPYFIDNPPYASGEVYLLFLKSAPSPGRENEYVIINPQGRYRIEDDRLVTPTSFSILNRELDGPPLEGVKSDLADYR